MFRESIEQEDIVAWVNVGTHHLTQAEVCMPRSLLALEVLNMLQDVPNTRMNTASSR